MLDQATVVLATFNAGVEAAAEALAAAVTTAETDLAAVKAEWDTASEATREELDALLRELQPAGTDAEEYLNLKKQVARLQPKEGEKKAKVKELEQLRSTRTSLLIERETKRGERLRSLTHAARKIAKS